MGHQLVFQLNTGNPLTPRFDDVFHPVDDLDVPVIVDIGDIAGVKPAAIGGRLEVGLVGLGSVVVFLDHGRPSDEQLSGRLSIPRERVSVFVNHLHL